MPTIETARDALMGLNPVERERAGLLRELIQAAVLAPSSHNTQPWSFKIRDGAVELYADRTRTLPFCDPEGRELVMSCGAALQNMRIALHHRGYRDLVESFPKRDEPDLLARVHPRETYQPSRLDSELFAAIARRHTNRATYRPDPITPELLDSLQQRAAEGGAAIYLVDDSDLRGAVADLIAEGDEVQGGHATYREELARWVRTDGSRTSDGIPASALFLPRPFRPLAPALIRRAHWGRTVARRDRTLALDAPALLVLWTRLDTRFDWLRAGEALQRMLLFATGAGLSASFFNQAVQLRYLREQLRGALGISGCPQLVLRLGYATEVGPTPRRGALEVLAPATTEEERCN